MKNFEKLEVGGVYVDKDGDRVTIMREEADGYFKGVFVESVFVEGFFAWYREDGRINYNVGQHGAEGGDLMEKVV